MRRLMLSVLAGSLVTACSGSMPAAPGSIVGGTGSTAEKPSGVVRNWTVHLTGANEVPVRDTPAQGQAIFQLSADGTELSWRLISSNIDNVTQAHIHMNTAGSDPLTTNGPIVFWLAGTGTPPSGQFPPGGGAQDGVLATGVGTSANLVGALAGQPLSALIAAMDAGRAYVNVHTRADGVAPDNTGPGDFPGGEIRGQFSAGH